MPRLTVFVQSLFPWPARPTEFSECTFQSSSRSPYLQKPEGIQGAVGRPRLHSIWNEQVPWPWGSAQWPEEIAKKKKKRRKRKHPIFNLKPAWRPLCKMSPCLLSFPGPTLFTLPGRRIGLVSQSLTVQSFTEHPLLGACSGSCAKLSLSPEPTT